MTENYQKLQLNRLKKCSQLSLVIFFIACLQSVLGISGIWNISANSSSRILFGIFELITIAALLFNSLTIMKVFSLAKQGNLKKVSQLCFLVLLLCFFGDIVNRNFSQTFYQFDQIIKHSYLAISVFFFMPGYALLIYIIAKIAHQQKVKLPLILISSAISVIIAVTTFTDIYIKEASFWLLILTSSYSIVVSILAVAALWLIKAFHGLKTSIYIWAVALGLILAMLADALIGKFWIFGNQGQGFFPIISHINWIIYIASHALIQQLPRGLLIASINKSAQR